MAAPPRAGVTVLVHVVGLARVVYIAVIVCCVASSCSGTAAAHAGVATSVHTDSTDSVGVQAPAAQRTRAQPGLRGRVLKARQSKGPKDTSPVLATADDSVRCWADRDPREFPRCGTSLLRTTVPRDAPDA